MVSTISDALAHFAHCTRYSDIPESALAAARYSLLDTFAVAIGAGTATGAKEAQDLAVLEGGHVVSSVWVNGDRLSARSATLVNSMQASALDYDSLHPQAVVHADIVTVPAALAVAEAKGAGGQDLLSAIVVGNEMLCRLGRSTARNSGWFYTSVYGSIASAASVAKLLGATADQVAGAMGIGYLASAGTQQPAVERSIGKRMQGALAAAAGVTAGFLGVRGLSGPREIVEGRFGLFRMYEEGDQGVITGDLGRRYEMERIAYKIYPSCQCNHAAIEGMLQIMRDYGLKPGDVESIEVYVSEYMERLVGARFTPGANPQVSAQFSIQYSIAATLLYGKFGISQIQESCVLDPRIENMAARVTVIVDSGNQNNYAPVRLRIGTHEGRTIDHEVKSYRGNVDMPLSASDMKEKLADCLVASGKAVKPGAVDRLFDFAMSIDQECNLSIALPRVIKEVFA